MSGYDRWRRLRHAAMAVRVGVLVKDGTPATIPVEQAAKFALIFNLKTARAMGLPVPQSLLLRADQVHRRSSRGAVSLRISATLTETF